MSTTQFAQASYQEVIDLHTESNTASVVGLHTPRGEAPYKLLNGFFQQFKKFKYTGCRFSLVPAARLPADPLQVSFESGEPTIDPRDMLNPIMFKGCHGNDMNTILNTLYSEGLGGMFPRYNSDSTEQNIMRTSDDDLEGFGTAMSVENLYYSALVDKTWLKAHPQAGMRKSGLRPLIYSLASNTPFYNSEVIALGPNTGGLSPQANEGVGFPSGNSQNGTGDGSLGPIVNSDTVSRPDINPLYVASQPQIPVPGLDADSDFVYTATWGVQGINFVTPRLQRLGWLDTMSRSKIQTSRVQVPGDDPNGLFSDEVMRSPTVLPLVYMGMIMLPPAYKTEQYYRLVIDHQFQFKDFRGISGGDYSDMSEHTYFNFNQ